jgi:hypothetical protein
MEFKEDATFIKTTSLVRDILKLVLASARPGKRYGEGCT